MIIGTYANCGRSGAVFELMNCGSSGVLLLFVEPKPHSRLRRENFKDSVYYVIMQ